MEQDKKESNKNFWKNLIETTFQAIKNLGNSGRTGEIREEVRSLMERSDENYKPTDEDDPVLDKLKDSLNWALAVLEQCGGYVVHAGYGLWQIAPNMENAKFDGAELFREWNKNHNKKQESGKSNNSDEFQNVEEIEKEETPLWRQELKKRIGNLTPTEFEIFIKNFLRQLGFTKVYVTAQSNDNGIDGYGTYMINDIIPMNIVFQCKHYKDGNNISRPVIQQFRGSIKNSNTIGLFVTTSAFKETAIQEASDPAYASQIVLLDGDDLIDLLCKYEIGVKKIIRDPEYEIDESFFDLIKEK